MRRNSQKRPKFLHIRMENIFKEKFGIVETEQRNNKTTGRAGESHRLTVVLKTKNSNLQKIDTFFRIIYNDIRSWR